MTENDMTDLGIGGFSIDAKPTDNDEYNWIHTNCETIASSIAMQYSPPGERVVAVFRMYRDHIQEDIEMVDGPVDPDKFIAWLQDHSRNESEVGEWEGEMFTELHEMFIGAVGDRGMQPKTVQKHFSKYVEETTAEMGLVEFFDKHE